MSLSSRGVSPQSPRHQTPSVLSKAELIQTGSLETRGVTWPLVASVSSRGKEVSMCSLFAARKIEGSQCSNPSLLDLLEDCF